MSVVLHAVALITGAAIVLVTWQSIIVTIILPRRTRNWIAKTCWLATYAPITAFARRARRGERRDSILALLGPINIVALLFTWMGLFALGFAFVMWSLGAGDVAESFDLAGSSIFTLGFATGKTGLSHFLMDSAAASGMIVVGLQIGYLPTIYSAYSQREALVTLLTMRAAEDGVLSGATILANHPLPASTELLRTLFASWETSAAAIIESHSNYPWLIAFRSPRMSESWVTSMLAVLDSIALLEALAPGAVPVEAQHCRFACTATLRTLSQFLVPQPLDAAYREAPLSYEAFSAALARGDIRVPFERDIAVAWPIFCESRASYQDFALTIAAYIELPVPASGWLRRVEPSPAAARAVPQALR